MLGKGLPIPTSSSPEEIAGKADSALTSVNIDEAYTIIAKSTMSPNRLRKREDVSMTTSNRIVLSSDHAAIHLRQTIAGHIAALGWVAVDIGPTTAESTHYPTHGKAAAQLVASGDCRFGIILCGTGQGIMMAANKVKGIRCGVCSDTFSARMIRHHNDANMLSLGVRVVGEGLALDIVDAFLTASFEGGRHATRVEMIEALEGCVR